MENNNSLNQRGRPTKYKPQYAKEAYQLCLLGYTDKQLANHFEVDPDTVKEWKKNHPDFFEALKNGKALADAKVAQSLYQRAIGFDYTESTFEKIGSQQTLENTSDEQVQADTYRKKVVIKKALPDVGAQMNWLKNRQKELWRDNLEIDFSKLTDEQLDNLIEGLARKAGAQP